MRIIATARKVKVEDKEDFTSGGFQDLTIEVELSKEYENLYNYVTFGNVAVPVIEGKVKTPTLTAGICKIGVYGYDGKEKLKLRYSPMPVDVLVKKGSFTDRTAQQSIPTPTEFEKCVDELRDLLKEAKIQDGSVTTEKLADEAVTTNKIATAAVTGSKVVEKAITRSKIADSAVNSAKIEDGAITTSKFAPGAVDDVALHPKIIEYLDSRAGRDEIPKRIKQLFNDTHFKEYVEILDATTANSYVSATGAKHKLLEDDDFYLAYFPKEINTQHTFKYSKAGKTTKSDNPAEYLIMYASGVAVGSNEVLLDENGEVDLIFFTDNDKYNYGGTSDYRILLGKPYTNAEFDIQSDWDVTKGTEMKGDSLLGDKSSVPKNYSVHLKQLGDSKQCEISCTVTFQKYERSGLTMKWVTKDAGVMTIPFLVTRPKNDSKFKGLYFIAATQTLLLSANTDVVDRLQIIENTLADCVRKTEPYKLLGEIEFDGSQTEKEYRFDFTEPFHQIFVKCENLSSAASSNSSIFASLLGSPSYSMADNGLIGKSGSKKNGLILFERYGQFIHARSEDFLSNSMTIGNFETLKSYLEFCISFDEAIPNQGKVSIYYA